MHVIKFTKSEKKRNKKNKENKSNVLLPRLVFFNVSTLLNWGVVSDKLYRCTN